MSKPDRAWKFIRSLQWAILIGVLAGLALTGLTYAGFVWELEPRLSILLGAGTAVGLSLVSHLLARSRVLGRGQL